MTRTVAFALLAAALTAAPAAAQRMSYGKAPTPGDTGPPGPETAKFEQKLGAQVPLDLTFYDHMSQPVTLRDCVGKKPTILVLAYFRCPKLCNQVLTGLVDTLRDAAKREANFVAGGPFNVVVVSIDPKEDPLTHARPRRQELFREYGGRSEFQPGFWFLSASHGQGTDIEDADRKIHQLADAVGFQYSLRQRNKEYAYQPDTGWVGKDGQKLPALAKDYDYGHASGVMVLTPEGKINQYLLGINYQTDEVRGAVADASGGKLGTLFQLSEQLPMCFVYDDIKGHYRPTMLLLAALYTPVMLGVVWFAVRTYRRGRKERPLVPGEVVSPGPIAN
jgi:protein SCO1/2